MSGTLADVVLVHAPARDGSHVDSHPGDIAFVDPDRPVIVWRETIKNRVDMGDLLYSTSRDGGRTWSAARVLLDHSVPLDGQRFGYGNVVLHAHHETVYAFAGRAPLSDPDSEEQRLVGMRSDDHGETWQPFDLRVELDSTLILGGKILPHADTFLLPFHRNETRHDLPPPRFRPRRAGDKRDHGVLVSRDLLVWRLAGLIPTRLADNVMLQEGYLAPDNTPGREGDVLCFMRTAKGDDVKRAYDPPRSFSSRSANGGQTWSEARIEPDLFNSSAKAIVTQDAFGTLVTVYNVGPAWERRALRYKTKRPGAPWGKEKSFFDGPGRNAYVSLAEWAPGQFYAMWWASTADGTRRAVRFGRFAPQKEKETE